MIKKHARANAKKYLNPEHTTRTDALAFSDAVNQAMKKMTGSTSVVLTIKPVGNAYRNSWKMNDRLVGIVRHGDLVTVMLSRQEQINKSHLRTDSIVRI